jgi:Flp pilus assembly protein TadD
VARLVGNDPEWRRRVALLRGQAYEGAGDVARAREAYLDVLRLDPGSGDARDGLGRLGDAPPIP